MFMILLLWLAYVVCVSIALVSCVRAGMLFSSFFVFGVYRLFVVCCVAGCCFIGLACVYVVLLLRCVRVSFCVVG